MVSILPDKLENVFIAYFVTGALRSNCYVIGQEETKTAIAIDVGMDAAATVGQMLDERGLTLAGVLCTHGHIDHCAQAAQLADAHHVPVFIHAADRELLSDFTAGLAPDLGQQLEAMIGTDRLAEPKDVRIYEPGELVIGGIKVQITPAPGHTEGSVLIGVQLPEGLVELTGDVLFSGSIGRSDMPGGNDQTMRTTLRDIVRSLPTDARVLPGHGPFSSVADELATNPYLTDDYVEAQI